MVALQRHAVGLRVGFGSCTTPVQFASIGILPESNMAYGVAEFGIYDPILPRSYRPNFDVLVGPPLPSHLAGGRFCPALTTAAQARHYGVALVLELEGSPGPSGTVPDGSIGPEGAFRVPGGGIVTSEPVGAPPDAATARPIPVSGRDPSEIHLGTDTAVRSTFYLHLGSFPGWTATIDGRPLALRRWADVELAATVPAGHHVVELRYRPRLFEVGLVLAGSTALSLTVLDVVPWARRRRSRPGPGGPLSP